MNEFSLFDRSVKILFRDAPDTICRLLNVDVPPGVIRTDDVSINVPELRADGLFVIGSPSSPPERGLYLEFQLDYPRRKTVEGWFAKVANLNYQRPYPVTLSVIYLTRGGRNRFPSSYTIHGVVKNKFTFHVIRLWEYIDRIRHGDLKALAPLLVLCENHPTVETLLEERAIIRGLDVDDRQRSELFALSIMVGRKYFTEDILSAVFGEEIPMIKELSFIEEWITEGEAKGKAEGKAEGERQMVLRLLTRKFGDIPPAARERINVADPAWCERMFDQALDAQSLAELDLS